MSTITIVGVLNVTPDSYYDGGKFDHLESAVKRAGEMIQQGADIIEIGGESTGPGSSDISPQEEINRTIEIIEAIKSTYPDQKLSIDTYKSEVASKAIKAGAIMINDVTAGRGDPKMFSVVAESNVDYVLMYSKDPTARTTIEEREYDDVIETINIFLSERINEAKAAGIHQSHIIIDPGMGHFVSAKPEYSFEIIDRLSELTPIAPVFISPSRKSFLAGPENLPPSERLPATIKASADAVSNGARYIRTHDVAEIRAGI
ncbi:MAG: dihydropteroate synthase [Candidatus Peribacteraceae bacterium]|jgi:dihydropteroate synthase|nr:dihydropteroate synthase [Candidatus Peribacteraceae bacterium]|tara:strand:+ start:5389 stop:6168 length:780 start_codon:yes stop_codon:yes gene_type:complete